MLRFLNKIHLGGCCKAARLGGANLMILSQDLSIPTQTMVLLVSNSKPSHTRGYKSSKYGLLTVVYYCSDNGSYSSIVLGATTLIPGCSWMTSPSLHGARPVVWFFQEWLPQMFRNQQHFTCAQDGDYYCSEEVRWTRKMGYERLLHLIFTVMSASQQYKPSIWGWIITTHL